MENFWDISEGRQEQIRHLPPELKRRIWEAIDCTQKDPGFGKPLEEDLAGYRSYRIGRYRLIYRIKKDRLVLEALGPRSDIYERFILEIGRAKIRERSVKYGAQPRKR